MKIELLLKYPPKPPKLNRFSRTYLKKIKKTSVPLYVAKPKLVFRILLVPSSLYFLAIMILMLWSAWLFCLLTITFCCSWIVTVLFRWKYVRIFGLYHKFMTFEWNFRQNCGSKWQGWCEYFGVFLLPKWLRWKLQMQTKYAFTFDARMWIDQKIFLSAVW